MALKIKAVKNIFINATKAVVKFAKAQKLAFAAGVIGIAIIALITILSFWDDINEAIQGTNKRLQKKIDLLNKIQALNKSEIGLLDKQIGLNKLQGKATDELIKQKVALIKLQRDLNKDELISLNVQLAKLELLGDELNIGQKIGRVFAQRLKGQAGFAVFTKNILDRRKEAIIEIQKLINSVTGEDIDLDILLFNIANPKEPKGKKSRKVEKSILGDIRGVAGADQDPELLALIEKNILIAKENEKRKEIDLIAGKLLTDQQKAESDTRLKIAELEAKGKIELGFLVSDAFASVGDLIGKETAAGKALSVASALIATWLNANLAYQSQLKLSTPDAPIRAAIAAGVAVAAGLANVKAILAVKVPGGAGGNVAPSGGGQQAPSFNVVGTSGTNQLAQALSSQDEPIQAFVVGSNVTTQQALDRNIIETATIG